MEIKAVKMIDGGFMNQPFAFGGEEGKDKFDEQIIYRSSLQNFLIDMGDEVILVDTGFQNDYKEPAKKLGAPLYMGEKHHDFTAALEEMGYRPEQVTKILLTHKHPDHSAALQYFPNAKLYMSPEEADALKLDGPNVVRATYQDGPYHNFPEAQQVADGVCAPVHQGQSHRLSLDTLPRGLREPGAQARDDALMPPLRKRPTVSCISTRVRRE